MVPAARSALLLAFASFSIVLASSASGTAQRDGNLGLPAQPLPLGLALAPVTSPPPGSASAGPSKSTPGCCSENMMNRPGFDGCSCVYPIEIGLLLENVSSNFINSTRKFQHQLASQLMLQESQAVITAFFYVSTSELNMSINMSIYLGPLVGQSFTYQEAADVKAKLDAHRVRFDSSLVSDYKLLRFELLGPPAHAPAPPLFSPAPTPSSPTNAPVNSSGAASAAYQKPKSSVNIGVILGVVLSVVILLCVSVIIFRRCGPAARATEEEKASLNSKGEVAKASNSHSLLNRPSSTRIFSYEDLREATNGFDPANLLGAGGFGSVYRGVLKDGTEVAIKRYASGGHQGDKEFLVEVEMLSRLHHRHLVKLVGYFTSRDSSEQLLCYELVPNGSLESWLHGIHGAKSALDWDMRMKIAIGAARGLAYLHEDCQPCVIHRDFKSSNILLENNFQPKVSDFGLAKQAPEGQVNYLSTRVMGTFGYVAPEYAMTGHLLVKSDVYSYGVVLLELLSGRRPVDMSQPSGEENLVTWARPLLKDMERIHQLADPRLGDKYPREDFVQVAAIAAACVAPEANQRPTMGEVVQSLKMVQRGNEYSSQREPSVSPATSEKRYGMAVWQRPVSGNLFESDGSSSVFSSGPFGTLQAEELTTRGAAMSEDLAEGR